MSSEVGPELERVVALLRRDYGLDPYRGGMIRTLARHLDARLDVLGLDVNGYLRRVESAHDERARLIQAMTVNHSWFFRDAKQLEAIGERMQELHAQDNQRQLELWVAGCATGQEAWTLAMMASQLRIPVRILATDVDATAVEEARRGHYGPWSLRELPQPLWDKLEALGQERWQVNDSLRELVEFEVHNLCEPSPKRRFDVICCRNVLIYFEPDRAHEAVARMRERLRPGGELVLGAGDLMFQPRIVDPGEASASSASPIHARAKSVSGPRPVSPRPAARGLSSTAQPALARRLPHPAHVDVEAVQAERERVERALEDRRSINNDPLRRELARAGREIVEGGEFEQALAVLEVLILEDPLLTEAHLWVGIAHHTRGEDRLAGESLRRARCLEPELWPGTLFAALNNERRGRWRAAARCWAELERLMDTPNAPAIEGTVALLDALPTWRTEALSLARQRNSKLVSGNLDGTRDHE